MSRKPPENLNHEKLLPPEVKKQSNLPERIMKIGDKETKVTVQTRQYKLITPLFGGGVEPGENDLDNLIRGTEIRGQLRFWWRATRGGLFGDDLEAMQKREGEIWGKAYKKDDKTVEYGGTVQITLEQPENVQPVLPFTVVKAMRDGQPVKNWDGSQKYQSKATYAADVHPYAAFSMQPTQEELDQFSKERELEQLSARELEQTLFPRLKKVSQCSNFKLIIIFSAQYCKDLEAALWAWETFGGIGARTRRGFGALRCVGIIENGQEQPIDLPNVKREDVISWLKRTLMQHIPTVNQWSKHVPHLNRQPIMGTHFTFMESSKSHNPLTIWYDLIEKLYTFRQMRPGLHTKHPGRSFWPEPSAIRKRTKQSLPTHENPIPNPRIDKFPRAAFGLPIIFQFKDRNKSRPDDKKSDPRKTVLQPTHSERLASPLILKPLACQNNTYIGLALILEGTGVEDGQMLLKVQEGQKETWDDIESTLAQGESLIIANQYSSHPIYIDEKTNALQAFLKYL